MASRPAGCAPPNAACRAICGDGEVTGAEQCDTPDEDACTNCQLNAGYDCGDDGTDLVCTETECGNGNSADPILKPLRPAKAAMMGTSSRATAAVPTARSSPPSPACDRRRNELPDGQYHLR